MGVAEAVTEDDVDVPLLLRDPRAALLPMLTKVRGWEEATLDDIKASQLSGAMTNLIYRCRYQRGGEKLFALARVFGNIPDDLFSRSYEAMIFRTVARAGMGPKLLVSFGNGRIEEFYVACNCLSAEQMAEADVARALAAAMASFHFESLLHLPPQEATEPQVWSRVRGWLKFAGELYGPGGLSRYGLDSTAAQAVAQIDALEARLTRDHANWLGFCHNDLQCGNVMLDASSLESLRGGGGAAAAAVAAVDLGTLDEECEPLGQAIAEVEGGSPRRGRSPTRSSPFGDSPRLHRRDHGRPDAGSPERRLRQRSLELQEADTRDAKGRTLLPRSSSAEWVAAPTKAIKLIDYEYSGVNAVAYDIANHWCEYAADYDTATPHVLDFSKMPSPARQADFADAYVASLQAVHSSLAAKGDALDVVERKVLEAQRAAGVSAAKPLPAVAARALATGQGALEAISAQLQEAARAYIPLSHLLWGLWGLIQAKSSEIDFDYEAYGMQRLGEFQRLVAAAGVNEPK